MKLVVAAVALVSAAVIVPASAVSAPRSHIETVQLKPKSKPPSEKRESERCFVLCWHSCWGLQCVERCRCECSHGKSDYCAKLSWGLRPKGK